MADRHDPTRLMVPLTHSMIRRGARALDLWSDDTLAEEIDVYDMAKLVLSAALVTEPDPPSPVSGEQA